MINIYSQNIHGLGLEKDKFINFFNKTKNYSIICIQETQVKKLNNDFFHLFSSKNYITKHTSLGQGICTIINLSKFPNHAKIEITDKTISNKLLFHSIDISFENFHTKILNSYISPQVTVFTQSRIFSQHFLVVGDLNMYFSGRDLEKDQELNNYINNTSSLHSHFYTFLHTTDTLHNFHQNSNKIGPDLVFTNDDYYDDDIPIISCQLVNTNTLSSDHFALNTSISFHNTRFNLEEPTITTPVQEVVFYDYSLITSTFKEEAYDSLGIATHLSDYYNMWNNWLVYCRKKKMTNSNQLNKNNLNFKSQQELEDFWLTWAEDSNSIANLGQTFNLINHFSALKEDSETARKDIVKVKINRKSKNMAIAEFESQISSNSRLTAGKRKQFKRAMTWWNHRLKRNNLQKFSMHELTRALAKTKRNTVGIDRVPFSFLPSTTRHLSNLLVTINNDLFSTHALPVNFLRTRTNFIPKNSTIGTEKFRPLSIANRFSCLVENLVCLRYQELLSSVPSYNSRFGCRDDKSIDLLMNDFHSNFILNKSKNLKQSLVSFDQTAAFNTVNLKLLLIKLKKAIQQSGNVSRFLIILVFSAKWAFGRQTFYNGRWFVFVVGLGQGLPLSVCSYILFFDFGLADFEIFSEDNEYYYMDDNNYLLQAKTWKELEDKAILLQQHFSTWCSNNFQKINDTKSTILFFNRRLPDFPSLGLLQVKNFVKCLGIFIDSKLNYCHHVRYLKKWFLSRVCVLKLLRCKLKIDIHVLMRIIVSMRMKCFHGAFFWLFLSNYQRSILNTVFLKLMRAASGISKLVPHEVIQNFFGVDAPSDYFSYIFSLRCTDGSLKIQNNVFDLLNEEFLENSIQKNTHKKYSFRLSTTLQHKTKSKFNKFTNEIFLSNRDLCLKGKELFIKTLSKQKLKNYFKLKLTRKILHRKTEIDTGIKNLNSFYYEKISG